MGTRPKGSRPSTGERRVRLWRIHNTIIIIIKKKFPNFIFTITLTSEHPFLRNSTATWPPELWLPKWSWLISSSNSEFNSGWGDFADCGDNYQYNSDLKKVKHDCQGQWHDVNPPEHLEQGSPQPSLEEAAPNQPCAWPFENTKKQQ